MDKRKALPKGIRCFLLLLQHILVVLIAISTVIIISNIVVIDDGEENETKGYYFNLLESRKDFKDTEAFFSLFYDQVEFLLPEVVIGSQIGADGVFDAEHIVNISDYANRKDNGYMGNSASPEYRLADLLKWYNYGLSFEVISFDSVEEFEEAFGITINSPKADNLIGTINSYSAMIECPCFAWTTEDEVHIEISVLREVFQPTDGVSLRERAADLTEYGQLISDLRKSINDLGINVQAYHTNNGVFSASNSNLRYYFVIMDEDGTEKVYSNFTLTEEGSIDNYFKELYAYVTFHSETLEFKTNIQNFNRIHFENELDAYSYVFDNTISAYIGVDMGFGADDIFAKAYDSYLTINNVWYYIGFALAAALLWLFLLVFLSVMAGRRKISGKIIIEETWVDLIPTEIHLALFGGLLFGLVFASVTILDETGYTFWIPEGSYLRIGVIAVAFVVSMLFSVIWYGFIRRIKLHILLKNSLCGMFVMWIWKLVKKLLGFLKRNILFCYNNLGTVARIVGPFSVLFVTNLVLVSIGTMAVTRGREEVLGMLIFLFVIVVDSIFTYLVLKANLCRRKIIDGITRISNGEMDYQLSTEEMYGENYDLANAVNSIGKGIKKAVETSMKDEKMKADLITNVSHDIKTPLTSIINYVDLLKRENIQTEPVKGYIEVLDAKSQRLKQLTDDLVEASKISSGNIVFEIIKIDFAQLLKQSIGEFSEKLEQKNLMLVEAYHDEIMNINVDPARMWRVIENLFNNILKYALEGTRVYIDLNKKEMNGQNVIALSIKNISQNPLNVTPDELTERFIRGDESRTTEGSGLGLSIAKNLTEAMGGKFEIVLDGDLFKVLLSFPEAE